MVHVGISILNLIKRVCSFYLIELHQHESKKNSLNRTTNNKSKFHFITFMELG